jgi:hypothetical protein
MPSKNKTSRVAAEQQLSVGLQKHLPKGASFTIAGKKYTLSQVVSLLQARLDATRASTAAQEAWLNAVATERVTLSETNHVLEAVRGTLLITMDPSQVPLSDFGIAARKPRAALTTKAQEDRIAKWRATRAARHTAGKKQKAKIKGVVPVTAPATQANGTSPVTPQTS